MSWLYNYKSTQVTLFSPVYLPLCLGVFVHAGRGLTLSPAHSEELYHSYITSNKIITIILRHNKTIKLTKNNKKEHTEYKFLITVITFL